MLYVRKATLADLAKMEEIIQSATAFLAEQGSPQWQNGYGPNVTDLQLDIQRGESYVLILDGQVVGVSALVTGVDPIYTAITEGTWDETYKEYLSIHRIAFDLSIRGQGLAKTFLQLLITVGRQLGYHDIRIDTYPRNALMEKAIYASGFTYQGMVKFNIPEGERKAYQVVID
ncbi:GNAT superfamily N-acetyltransferase [Enterococcus sp. PF1-24]|uniref:GNAT family N-acetyltransferase n=1 Tax=unclassified Enterococcus TaxID=2608891 RepID=UPI002473FC1D|nr:MULTISPECIES: GNAT family protein [unclassified Enterococcus]MDH6364041.1 GNAT superfamily N-acetyltransferase [Enterococcus sp. PFB1-1]MDH6401142.1 GNAT superfamily N-acetyltransferase [Enterococcus sp. PF1-24]